MEREIATRLVRVPQRVGQRLGTELIGQIMDEYATGTPTTQLALRYRMQGHAWDCCMSTASPFVISIGGDTPPHSGERARLVGTWRACQFRAH